MTDSAAPLLSDAIARIRTQRPLVHMITNLVSMAACAQSVKALGASTIFAHDPGEALETAVSADAVVINIGTSVPGVGETLLQVARGCQRAGIPVVLDPVGAGATTYRRRLTRALMATGAITVVSGNAAEVASICGIGAMTRGADAVATDLGPAEIALTASLASDVVVAVSGAVDYIAGARMLVGITNGHQVMGQVVGTGSARSAVLGAFVAVAGSERFRATVTATCAYGVAGEHAAACGNGPGYFFADLYNTLAALDDTAVAAGARLEVRTGRRDGEERHDVG